MSLHALRPGHPEACFLLVLLFLNGQFFLVFFYGLSRVTPKVGQGEMNIRIKSLDTLRQLKNWTGKNADEPVYLGIGEYGKGFHLKEDDLGTIEKAKLQAGYEEHGFNEYLSDMISFHRKLPTTLQDPRCSSIEYPPNLPKVSVVIPFKDEAFSALIRTVHGVLERSSAGLVQEIILVDDNSSLPQLKSKLDLYAFVLPNVFIVRLNRSVGLMMARQSGIERARYDVIVVMDSHVEVALGWLEPLLYPIHLDSKVMTFSAPDCIDKDTFQYSHGKLVGQIQVSNFDFYLNMIFSSYKKEYIEQRERVTDPYVSPTIQGWLFAMNRKYFWELGGFDPGMEVWGGEQFELSFKVWMCGGRILMPPCSHAGHLYRAVKWKDSWKTYMKNSYRVAETWMDEYSELMRERTGGLSNAGDISARLELRKRLQCKSFDWYLKTIEEYIHMYVPRNRKAKGMIKNPATNFCIKGKYHGSARDSVPEVSKCKGNEGFEFNWDLSEKDEIRHQNVCVDVKEDKSLKMNKCDEFRLQLSQKWIYTKENTIVHGVTEKCLTVPEMAEPGSTPVLKDCEPGSDNQRWVWERL